MGPDREFEELRTARLVVRRFRPADVPTFAAYRSDPEVARYQSWDVPFSEEQAEQFVDGLSEDDPDTPGSWFQFAVAEADSGTHIGDVAAYVDADEPRQARVGVTLAADAQGRGYGAEALARFLDYLLVDRGKHRVTADCDARNVGSAKLLDRVGMRREAHHLRSSWWKGEWTDEYVYAVLADDWRARRG
jgi:aminoglycoside 6'-N-acetyltransferase